MHAHQSGFNLVEILKLAALDVRRPPRDSGIEHQQAVVQLLKAGLGEADAVNNDRIDTSEFNEVQQPVGGEYDILIANRLL